LAIVLVSAAALAMSLAAGHTSANRSKDASRPSVTAEPNVSAKTGGAVKPSGAVKPQAALPEWATKGRFEPPAPFPGDAPVMIHASVLPDGKVLFWGRDKEVQGTKETIFDLVSSSKARLWDPVTGGVEMVDNLTTNLFCSGHSLLPNGRLFVSGGHTNRHPNSQSGDDRTNIFDPVAKSWSPGPTMQHGRWYPFHVTLETGEVAILAGLYETDNSTTPPAVTAQLNPEIYNPQTNTLEVLAPSASGLPTYPYVFLDPVVGADPVTGKQRGVFIAGPKVSYFWNPRGANPWSLGLGLTERFQDGSAVMYDSEQGGVLMVGGRRSDGQAITTAKKITLNKADPQWEPAGNMTYPRSWHTTTLLPDGKVLVTGGTPCYNGQLKTPCYIRNPLQASDWSTYGVDITQNAELWNPASGQWSLMAKGAVVRGYHSVAFLLPDATVAVAGYGYPDGQTTPPDPDPYPTPPATPPTDAFLNERRHTTGERNVEIYKPPYLFDGSGNEAPRPDITSAPSQVAYGQQFNVTYGNAAGVNRVAWVRLPSVTHGFNQDQRINVLPFTAGPSNQLTVTAPTDSRKCPPGYYMLFVFNTSNVPSKAKVVRISTPTTPALSVNDVSLAEGNAGTTTFNFTVSLSAPAGAGGVSFNIVTADGTASAASGDFTAKSLTAQTIPAGGSTYTFSVQVNGDTNTEADETFSVNVSNVTGATVADGQGQGTIQNDDVARAISVNDVTQAEGNAGATNFNFTVSLNTPAPAGGVSFNIATADGTATAASGDYVAKSLAGQTIPAGGSTYSFSVQVNGDANVEPNEAFFVNVSNVVGALVGDGQGQGLIVNDEVTPSPPSLVWFDDALPAGAVAGADAEGWTWISSNPSPFSGGVSHQSPVASGIHQHYFTGATHTLPVSVGDSLFVYVYLDPANPPLELMLQWYEPTYGWEHRAYWGGNYIRWGSDGTNTRRYMGPLPPAGQWVRLEVPALKVGMEGRTATGMSFALANGRAAWDYAGVTNTQPHTVWFNDALPAGAVAAADADSWNWISSNPLPASGGLSHQSLVSPGIHQHYFTGATATLPVNTGDKMVAYVYLDPANPPREIMLQWYEPVTGWEHRAYWGGNYIWWGSDTTITRRYMGPLPPPGQWIRLEVPASHFGVGLEGRTVSGMAFTLYDGRAAWDYAGKTGASSAALDPAPGLSPRDWLRADLYGLRLTDDTGVFNLRGDALARDGGAGR